MGRVGPTAVNPFRLEAVSPAPVGQFGFAVGKNFDNLLAALQADAGVAAV